MIIDENTPVYPTLTNSSTYVVDYRPDKLISPIKKTVNKNVDHPSHYKGDKFECIDVMEEVYGKDAVKHFCILNAFKYIYRQNKKNGTEDVEKALWYLNKYIELDQKGDSNE